MTDNEFELELLSIMCDDSRREEAYKLLEIKTMTFLNNNNIPVFYVPDYEGNLAAGKFIYTKDKDHLASGKRVLALCNTPELLEEYRECILPRIEIYIPEEGMGLTPHRLLPVLVHEAGHADAFLKEADNTEEYADNFVAESILNLCSFTDTMALHSLASTYIKSELEEKCTDLYGYLELMNVKREQAELIFSGIKLKLSFRQRVMSWF